MGGGGVTTRLPGRSVPGPAGGGTTVVVPAGGNAGETVPAGGTALVLGTAIPVFGVVVGGVGVVLAPDAGLNPRPPIAPGSPGWLNVGTKMKSLLGDNIGADP